MTGVRSRLVVITPAELAEGFRLTGVFTSVAESSEQAEQAIRALLHEGERGVICIHAPLFAGLDKSLQTRLRTSVAPVVVELPTGMGQEDDNVRRTRLAERLQHAIGYHVTFGEDTP